MDTTANHCHGSEGHVEWRHDRRIASKDVITGYRLEVGDGVQNHLMSVLTVLLKAHRVSMTTLLVFKIGLTRLETEELEKRDLQSMPDWNLI
ncbi:hypothetical protein CNMCM5793_000505 [Aspergillus hiratsukae]|uniref:Uncharacterized protein n=1 Tax=Aspergillus hiratsukae TaxID=1194566 RepID=A0A8H6UG48_9EURO|nr:hypothetical protein CNMCM5793_000505 [Aspergillus hiratsukae]KAF7156956.1 hypothetical protein CNMCM6106_001735 [Aspergillus hiratsukae]